jgi:hypothetical protein
MVRPAMDDAMADGDGLMLRSSRSQAPATAIAAGTSATASIG